MQRGYYNCDNLQLFNIRRKNIDNDEVKIHLSNIKSTLNRKHEPIFIDKPYIVEREIRTVSNVNQGPQVDLL